MKRLTVAETTINLADERALHPQSTGAAAAS